MRLFKYFYIVSIVAIISSCSKTSNSDGTTIAAKTMLDVAYGTDPLQKMDIYLPANRSTTSTKVIIMIHGGAWSLGDKADFAAYVDTMKNRIPDYAIININYRLAAFPANLFPTQELDTKAATEFIYGNRSTYLISDKFVMMGASAGGHLALLQAYKYTGLVKVKAVVDFFGPTDMADLYNNPGAVPASSLALIVGGTPTTNPTMYFQSSPINFVTTLTPPTIILQGGVDPLVNATRQSFALKTKLSAAAVINQYVFYPLGGHGDWDAATFKDAFDQVVAFLAANVH